MISIVYYSELLYHVSKNGKSWHVENKPISVKNLTSIYFRRARTLSISHSPRPPVARPIRNAEIMEYLLAYSDDQYGRGVKGNIPFGREDLSRFNSD